MDEPIGKTTMKAFLKRMKNIAILNFGTPRQLAVHHELDPLLGAIIRSGSAKAPWAKSNDTKSPGCMTVQYQPFRDPHKEAVE